MSPVSGLNFAVADRGLDTRRDGYRPVGNLPTFYEDDDEGAFGFRPINRMPSPVPSHRSQHSHSSRRSQDEVVNLAHRLADDLAQSFRQQRDDTERERKSLQMRFEQELHSERRRFQQELQYERALAAERAEKALLAQQLQQLKTLIPPLSAAPGFHELHSPGAVPDLAQPRPASQSQPQADQHTTAPAPTAQPAPTVMNGSGQDNPTLTALSTEPPANQPAEHSVTPPAAAAASTAELSHAQPTTRSTTSNVNTADGLPASQRAASADYASTPQTAPTAHIATDMTTDSHSSQVTATPSTVIVHQIRTPKSYSGKSSWKLFKQHFERIAKINKWTSNADKFQNLSLALESQAAEVLIDIDENSDSAYQDAWNALAKRFGSVDDQREAMHRFDSRKQNADESVAEFVAALKLAYHEAWPQAHAKNKDNDLKRKFENGLRSTEMQHYLRLHARTDDFVDTVTKARQFESLLHSTTAKKSVSIITDNAPAVNVIQSRNMQDRLTKLEQTLNAMATPMPHFGQRQRHRQSHMNVTAGQQQSRPRSPQFGLHRPPTPPGINTQPTFDHQTQTRTGPARRRGCWTCGTPGCHSDRHANDQPMTNTMSTTQPSQPRGCWTCGTPGCHSDRHANDQPTTQTPAQTTQPGPPSPPPLQSSHQGNGSRSSFHRGSRTPTIQNRPASR